MFGNGIHRSSAASGAQYERVPILPTNLIRNFSSTPNKTASEEKLHSSSFKYQRLSDPSRRSFSFKESRLGRAWTKTKEAIKQYGVLWFIIYWATFVPLFMVFTIPFRLGMEIVPTVEWLDERGWMDWTKVFKVDTQKVIERIHNNDDFELMNNRVTGQIKYEGRTANMFITTFLIWELAKPLRYLFYLFLCRRTVLFCRKRGILPKFFKKF
ncbi:Oidioi.mRNA.OKI2018_I69.chr2.g6417.t1.cds [Oikopleura dioica]|uniref:Oidioi.mRNA.OKI2018_I69.chr2.g6417.t1.cds n=1 Tax=Oikopleura dioica TaxID=34765 RepID=A0ABN7TA14_OIKDI|nr:Oidioi.mRNA.OKI2018_I69.chr2.g6417.t1.cds [Oikopleura dioica]